MVDDNIPYAKALFGRLGEVQPVAGREIRAPALAMTDALMVRSVTRVDRDLIDGSRVKFVGTATAGTDHVDKYWLKKSGISFAAAPGCNAIAVVEYVFSALLLLAQREGFALRDKTIGIVGAGNVGSRLQRRLNAFGVHTLLCDPPLAEAQAPGNWQPLEKLVIEADVLTFHTPLTCFGRHATWHMVDEALLSTLPPGRIIINACRGEVVDNAALLRVLEGGKHLRVVLDVWDKEPELLLPLLARVDIGTAHIAGYTVEGKARGTTQLFDAYSAFVGNDTDVSLSLLPPPALKSIRLRGAIDEAALRRLAHLVYDVRRDDMQLRQVSGILGAFDQLRRNYYQRREWSSLCVDTDNETSADTLRHMGFRARSV